jgi:hypothetical protein
LENNKKHCITIKKELYDRIEDIRKKYSLHSQREAIEYLVMKDGIKE